MNTQAAQVERAALYLGDGGALAEMSIRVEGEIAGSVGLKLDSHGNLEIDGLQVAEKFRGQGVGNALVQMAVQVARQLRIERIVVQCSPHLGHAQTLYLRNGFVARSVIYQRNLNGATDPEPDVPPLDVVTLHQAQTAARWLQTIRLTGELMEAAKNFLDHHVHGDGAECEYAVPLRVAYDAYRDSFYSKPQ